MAKQYILNNVIISNWQTLTVGGFHNGDSWYAEYIAPAPNGYRNLEGPTITLVINNDELYGASSTQASNSDMEFGGRPGDSGPYIRYTIKPDYTYNDSYGTFFVLRISGQWTGQSVSDEEVETIKNYPITLYYDDGNDDSGGNDDNTSSSVSLYVSLSSAGIATASYSLSNADDFIDISSYEMYLYKLSDSGNYYLISSITDTTSNTYNFSSVMTYGTYYVKCIMNFYYMSSDFQSCTATSNTITYGTPPEEEQPVKNSFNGLMTAIANAVRSKASISGTLSIKEMITTLNGLTTTGSPNYDSYTSTNFDSCMTKLSKVIRSQNGTISNTSGLTISQMPDAIDSIVIRTSSDNEGPLTLYINTGNGYIEINSNAYMYSDAYGTISWYGEYSGFLYSKNISSFDGATYYINTDYVSTDGEYVYAKVTISIDGYSITRTSESFRVSGSGGSCGDEQCSQCTESTGCCESNDECSCQGPYCEGCEGSCMDCESGECVTCEYGCQD